MNASDLLWNYEEQINWSKPTSSRLILQTDIHKLLNNIAIDLVLFAVDFIIFTVEFIALFTMFAQEFVIGCNFLQQLYFNKQLLHLVFVFPTAANHFTD